MAEALTRRRSRRKRTPDPHERELERLRLSLSDDTGFRFYLATYDQPRRRDALVARAAEEAAAEKVKVTRLDIGEADPETNLVELLRTHLQETKLPTGWRRAVMVTGIEQRIDYSAGREGFAFLHQANLLRDALPEAAPVPVVLWLSRMASAALAAEAPDLWHWRAANFDLTGDEAPRAELLRELTTLRPEEDLGFSREQREARVRMLEDLLAELERDGAPKSKREAAERANLLLELGIELWRLGRGAEAIPRFERALAVFREIGDRAGEGNALGNLGIAWADLGEPRRAIECHEQALKISREIGDRRAEGQDLGNLGNAWADLGEPRRAIEYYEQQLVITRAIGDRRGEGTALGNLGIAWVSLGEPRRAIEFYEQHLAIAREIGDRRGEGASLFNSALALDALGERDEAVRRMREALAIFEAMGAKHLVETARAQLPEWGANGPEASEAPVEASVKSASKTPG